MASLSAIKNGVFAAALTPFTDQHEPDCDALSAHLQWLLESGCDGVAPLGTTGEANSLSRDQRVRVIQAVAKANIPSDRAIIGTGSCSVSDTVFLSKLALSSGYPNVLIVPPFFYKNVSDDGLFLYFSTVIDQISDPDLRIFLYHFPQMSAVPFSIDLVGRLQQAHGEVISGLKDSSGDWSNTKALIEAFPNLAVFSGTEQFLCDNLALGGAGCISATTNVTAQLAAKVVASAGSKRQELQDQLTQIRLMLQQYPLVGALKQIMEWHTGRQTWRNILPPLTSLPQEQSELLRQKVTSSDFFNEYFSFRI